MPDINNIINEPGNNEPEAINRKMDMDGWTRERGEAIAEEEGLSLGEMHWQVVDFLRDYYIRHGKASAGRVLAAALDEAFAAQGGTAYLLTLFPKGPVAQASRIGGLPVPAYTVDQSFGSAM